MTEQEAILRTIIENPEDDLCRLVYADWLDENGQPERAEFVRVQCEIARLDEHKTTCDIGVGVRCGRCRYCWLLARERWLWGLWEASTARREPWTPHPWFPDLPGEVVNVIGGEYDRCRIETWRNGRSDGFIWHIRRGFVSQAHCTLADWIGRQDYIEVTTLRGDTTRHPHLLAPGIGPAIVRRHPVTRVELTDREPEIDGTYFRWHLAERMDLRVPERNTLPGAVFRRVALSPDAYWTAFRTSELAHDALTSALLLWAKSAPPSHRHQG